MSAINDGSPAFPDVNNTGISLRDYFAAKADIPWGATMETLRLKKQNTSSTFVTVNELVKYRAKLKYLEADAMLAERERSAG